MTVTAPSSRWQLRKRMLRQKSLAIQFRHDLVKCRNQLDNFQLERSDFVSPRSLTSSHVEFTCFEPQIRYPQMTTVAQSRPAIWKPPLFPPAPNRQLLNLGPNLRGNQLHYSLPTRCFATLTSCRRWCPHIRPRRLEPGDTFSDRSLVAADSTFALAR